MEEKLNPLANALLGIRQKANDTPIGEYYNYNLLDNLQNYADYRKMTPQEFNKFKHITGTKQTINDWGLKGLGYALGKESFDVFVDGLNDTGTDLKNDLRAVKLHINKPSLSDGLLYDYVFENYIKPYRK